MDGNDFFPGVNDASICRPPRMNEPREIILPDGTVVKWCPECGVWGDHFRAGHSNQDPPPHNNDDLMVDDALVAEGVVVDADLCEEVHADDEVSDGNFAQLQMAGLL